MADRRKHKDEPLGPIGTVVMLLIIGAMLWLAYLAKGLGNG